MARPELGTKRDCPNCDAKFYDLNRNPAVCPKCGYTLAAEMASARARPARAPKEEPAPTPPKPKPEVVPVAAPVDEEDEALAVDDGTEISLEELEDDDVEIDEGDGDSAEDAFLEADDEEEGSDVTDLIGGHPGDEEER